MSQLYYILGVMLILAFFYRMQAKRYDHQKIFFWLSFALLFFFQIFKNPFLLPDGATYWNIFKIAQGHSFASLLHGISGLKIEVGYWMLNKSLSIFSKSPFILFAVSGVLILIGPLFLIKKYSHYIILSILFYLLYVFIDSLGLIRQYLAYSVTMLTFPFILKKKTLYVCILAIIAFFIHQSSICFYVVYPLFYIKNLRTLYLTTIGGTIVIGVFFAVFSRYVGEDYEGYLSETFSTLGTAILMVTILLFRFYVLGNRMCSTSLEKLLTILLLIACMTSILGTFLPGLWYRLIRYYSCISVFLTLPNTLQMVKRSDLRNIFSLAFMAILIYLFYSSISNTIYSYRFIWNLA